MTPWAASGYFAGIGAYLAQAKVVATLAVLPAATIVLPAVTDVLANLN